MDASCGPSNALNQLSKHSQRDRSLQHESFRPGAINQNNGQFKNQPGFDENLNNDFEAFNRGGMAPQFNPISMDQNRHFHMNQQNRHQNQQNLHIQQNQNPLIPNQNSQNQWIQDFNGLSINGQKNDWHQQFMAQMRPESQSLQNNGFNQVGRGNFAPQFRNHQFSPIYNQPQNLQNLQNHQNYETQESAFDDHFEQLEKELADQEIAQQNMDQEIPQEIDNMDKEQFAKAARQVQNSMTNTNNLRSQETNNKFEQSNFLKLMSSISDRKVELSNDGGKLVDASSGQDIRDHLSDPLKHEKQPDYHEPQFESERHFYEQIPNQINSEPPKSNESQNVTSHLPDPLAHIKDGQLPSDLSPFQAAQVVSGGQVQGNSWMEDELWGVEALKSREPRPRVSIMDEHWQEVYDDYRHDDT